MKTLHVDTKKRTEMVDVTEMVQGAVVEEGFKDGFLFLFCPHTTAGLTINENADPSVKKDIINFLEQIVPYKGNYSHLEGNSDAHIKSVLTGTSLTLPVWDGRVVLGGWQGIFFCEYDGPRNRNIYFKFFS